MWVYISLCGYAFTALTAGAVICAVEDFCPHDFETWAAALMWPLVVLCLVGYRYCRWVDRTARRWGERKIPKAIARKRDA